MSFFKCQCEITLKNAVNWCNITVHDIYMIEGDVDACEGTDPHDGEATHCTSFSVDEGDLIECKMCKFTWVHYDE